MHNMEVITLENKFVKAKFLNYGATVLSFEVLEEGEYVNKILTFEIDEYIDNGLYCGAICGPTAGRIKDGVYQLNGTVELSKNGGDHHLHGGVDSYARKYFDYLIKDNEVVFTYSTNNQEYPGKQEIKITYFIEGTSLGILFEADTDTDIPMNLTNHMYFTAFERDNVLKNKMKLSSTKRIELENYAPVRVVEDNTYMELNQIKELDDPYILDEGNIVYESEKHRMEVITDYDAVVIYTQNSTTPMIDKVHQGICFETQKWPNGINISGYDAVLKAGEHYKHKTVYKFSRK